MHSAIWLTQDAYKGLTHAGFEQWAKDADHHVKRACDELELTPIKTLGGGIKGAVLQVIDKHAKQRILKVTPKVFADVEVAILESVSSNVPTVLAQATSTSAFLMVDHGTSLLSMKKTMPAEQLAEIVCIWNQPTRLQLPYAEQAMHKLLVEATPTSPYPPALDIMFEHAKSLLQELPPAENLVHGDLHRGNVLISESGNFTVIDPLGMKGDSECEIGQSAAMSHAVSDICQYVEHAAQLNGLDTVNALKWTLVRTAISAGDNYKAGHLHIYCKRLVKYSKLKQALAA